MISYSPNENYNWTEADQRFGSGSGNYYLNNNIDPKYGEERIFESFGDESGPGPLTDDYKLRMADHIKKYKTTIDGIDPTDIDNWTNPMQEAQLRQAYGDAMTRAAHGGFMGANFDSDLGESTAKIIGSNTDAAMQTALADAERRHGIAADEFAIDSKIDNTAIQARLDSLMGQRSAQWNKAAAAAAE